MVIDKPACAEKIVAEEEGRVSHVKMPLFIASAFLTLFATSHFATGGGGFHGSGSRGGFVAHVGTPFRTGSGVHRNFVFRRASAFNQNRRLFHRDRRLFFSQQFVWPGYWFPYFYPYDYSYLDDGPDDSYQYWDDSAARAQPDSSRSALDHGPIVIVNNGNSRPTDSSPTTEYHNNGYGSNNDTPWQRRMGMQDPNEKIGPRTAPEAVVPPAVTPPPARTTAQGTQTTPQTQAGPFGHLVLVSWLEDGGRDVIYVQNTETNDIQKITSEPNLDKFRIVELHPNADPKLFEAVISNGSQQGPVRFHF
ncbi:MAG: hypothetical protein JO066_15520 [Verrucomicrobia bacterium]|nr:hypothetical protein [Verrucomicrobiota bacterium]